MAADTDRAATATSTAAGSDEHARDADSPGKQHRTNWGVFAYTALGLLAIALVWALMLQTTLVNRTGDTASTLTDLASSGQQARDRHIDRLQDQLDKTTSTAQTDAATARRDATTRADQLARQVDSNDKAWQKTVRAVSQNEAAASRRRAALAEEFNRRADNRQAAVEGAARSAVERAQARQAAAEAAARSALARALERRSAVDDAARRALAREQEKIATERAALRDTTELALEMSVEAVRDRAQRARTRYEELLSRLNLGTTNAHLPAALRELVRAERAVVVAARRLEQDALSSRAVTRLRRDLRAARAALTVAESELVAAAAQLVDVAGDAPATEKLQPR